MEDKLVIMRQSSRVLKYRPRPESTSAVKKQRRDGCEGRSESKQKRLKLQVPKSNVDRDAATVRLQIGILRHGVRSREIVLPRIRSFIQQANQTESENQTSHPLNQVNENDDVSKQKLSSPLMMKSDEESAKFAVVPSHLIIKAANAAVQWLDFIHEDLMSRLAVLRKSTNIVRAAIRKGLAPLISEQFSNPNKIFSAIDEKKKHAHRAKWNGIFFQIERSLNNEERNIKNLLEQVEEMKLLCDSLDYGSSGEKELVVRAAAVSILSLCNKMLHSMLWNGSITLWSDFDDY